MPELTFIRPWWLLALPLAVLVPWRAMVGGDTRWRQVCDPALLPHLLVDRRRREARLPRWLLGLAIALAVLALAGPSWRSVEQPLFRSDTATVVVLDLSRSMDAQDVRPSRLARARIEVADVLTRAADGQTALVVFAGDAFDIAPLTDDARTVVALLGRVSTTIAPIQGSRPDLGLSRALDLLTGAGARSGRVVLVTDGVEGEETAAAAARLAGAGYSLSVLGVGTGQGAPIPRPEGGFVRDGRGEIALATLDPEPLAAVAAAGRGRLVAMTADDADTEALLAGITPEASGAAAARDDGDARHTTIARDEGPWLALALLPLAAAGFRRGWLLAVALVAWLPLAPTPAQAESDGIDWQALWWRPDQRAARALAAGDPAAAAAAARSPDWRGSALYRAGDFEAAARAFATGDRPTDHYNRGNALARGGRLNEALAAYDAALAADPGLDDAQANRELVRRLLEQTGQQSRPDGGQGGGEAKPDTGGGRPDDGDGEGDGVRPDRDAAGEQATSPGDPAAGDGAESARSTPPHPGAEAPGDAAPSTADATGSAAGAGDQGASASAEPSAPRDAGTDARRVDAAGSGPDEAATESQQQAALETWLRKIPDDPGGLLRRKLALEHAHRGPPAGGTGPAW
ncbi:MAG: VWA domain-containing protein [Ectothiorhodospiraceae bacterium]|nr:VWA domain-containing protein [Chromatiales bacterium]MCP5155733.1 VWA domain-containing protein [Ectothiorhodospiraceae bacterium]